MPNIIQKDKNLNKARPVKELHRSHPFNDQKNHDTLRDYVHDRVTLGLNLRDAMVHRYVKTDKQIAGYLILSDEDKERARKKDATGQQLAVEVNLPLTHIHIDDMATYIAETSAPAKAIYHAADVAREQNVANAMANLMNEHAEHADHFSNISRSGLSALKYNICCMEVEWHTQHAPSFAEEVTEGPVQTEVIWNGNRLNHMDMYNTFWDPTVSPQDIPEFGEYAGKITRISGFGLKRLVDAGVYHNIEKIDLTSDQTNTDSMNTNILYRDAAIEVGLGKLDSKGTDAAGAGTDWFAFIGIHSDMVNGTALSLVHTYIWLNPIELNLVANTAKNRDAGRNRLELWKIVTAGSAAIVFAEREKARHGYIPMSFGAINYDDLGIAQRSVAEIIDPLQTFASFSLNTHIQATRKNIWDLTVYDPTGIDFTGIPDGEVAARVPLKEGGHGRNINDMIWQNSNLIDTRQTVENMNMIMGLLEDFYPTQSMPSQIAGIDRAIESQVAAVTQGTTRRMKQAVRTLDSTVWRWSRVFQYYNILQFHAEPIEIMGDDGKKKTVQVKDFKTNNVIAALGQGLKTMDRELIIAQLTALTQMVLQSPNAVQQTDIMLLINAISDYMGIEVDFRQFKLTAETPPAGEGGEDDPANAGGVGDGESVQQPIGG